MELAAFGLPAGEVEVLVPLPEAVVDMVIARLRSDDIYHQTQCFPHPKHRIAAAAGRES